MREKPTARTVNGVDVPHPALPPRIEGLFARIERWTNVADPADTFWRSISKDNITTWYGKTAESRIADPADPTRIFTWLICESYDDKGNVIVYDYKPEDSDGRRSLAGPRTQSHGDPDSAMRSPIAISSASGTATAHLTSRMLTDWTALLRRSRRHRLDVRGRLRLRRA